MGLVMGFGMSRCHPSVNPGWWLAVPVAFVGGLVGSSLWAQSFAPRLADSHLAGVTVAGALGGAVLVISTAFARHLIERKIR